MVSRSVVIQGERTEPDLRYPVGKFEPVTTLTPDQRRQCIDAIADAPARLAAAVAGLTPAQLDTPYRLGGWTVRQLVHHIADSHMNAFSRFKFALTEDEPTIKTYDETRWAELADAKMPPIELSLALLENLHKRWVVLLRSLEPSDWPRKFRHPEWGLATVDFLLAQYAWHGRHHVAQITSLRERNGW
ncbi:MAG: YfiT family bacillithiol transferase [Candidatus Acidiferrales bacterium]